MKTKMRLILAFLAVVYGLALMAQQPNLLPTTVSNFNIGTVGCGHANNNLSNVGVNTEYSYVTAYNGLHPDDATGKYAIGDNARYYNQASSTWGETGFFQMGDHTNGHGNYMIINGSTITNPNYKKVWEYTVNNLTPGVIYIFEAYVTCLFMNPTQYSADLYRPKLRLRVNNQNVGSQFTIPWVNGGSWTKWQQSWTANATSATIAIYDEFDGDNGNDFGIDDVSFRMASGYALTATNFNKLYCRSCVDECIIDLNNGTQYTCTNPMGAVTPDFAIQNSNGSWVTAAGPNNTITTAHGTAYFFIDSSNRIKIRYTVQDGYYGEDVIHYKVSKYGLSGEGNITVQAWDNPSDPVPPSTLSYEVTNYLCASSVSGFNPNASWNANGNAPWPKGWKWSYTPAGPWYSPSLPNTVGMRFVRFWAKNTCAAVCDTAWSEPLVVSVCSAPEITNNNMLPVSICAGSELPVVQVDWHYSEPIYTWQYKRNNTWHDLNNLGDLMDGDYIRYCANNLCGNPVYSSEILITSGPEFVQNNVTNPFANPPEGYCPNTPITKPTIPTSWYNTNGLTGVQSGWYYVTYDISGNASYEPITGNTINLGTETRYVTCALTSSCGTTPYDPPFELLVYEAPAIEGMEALPDSLGPVCAGTGLGSILPQLSPSGHYTASSWQMSSGTSPSGYSDVSPSMTLTTGDNMKWLRYHVVGCSYYNEAVSTPIRVWVGDKPTLNTATLQVPTSVCDGTSIGSLVSGSLMTDVHVTNWNLFDNNHPDDPAYEQWEVFYNGQWIPFTTFQIAYSGCALRYHAHNNCGDVTVEASGTVSVTEGPEFNNPGAALDPQYFSNPYCVTEPLYLTLAQVPSFQDHGVAITDTYWAWSYDGIEYTKIPNQNDPTLTEVWHEKYVSYVIESECGGKIVYPTAFQLYVIGDPEVISTTVEPETLCEGALLTTAEAQVDWHHGLDTTASTWQYSNSNNPNSFVNFDPFSDPLPAGTNYVRFQANNGCMVEASDPWETVTVRELPYFANPLIPFTLNDICEGGTLELPTAPEVLGYYDESGWLISKGTDQYGEYTDTLPDQLSLADNGRWLRYFASGCGGSAQREVEIHIIEKPVVVYDITPMICSGQKLHYSIHHQNDAPVTSRIWKYTNSQGSSAQFDPDEFTFNVVGSYDIYYAVLNDCSDPLNPEFVGPSPMEVSPGPEFQYDASWPASLQVCEGMNFRELMEEYGIQVPSMTNPNIPYDDLGWYMMMKDANNVPNYYPLDYSEPITDAFDGVELCYAVKGECSDIPVYTNGIVLNVFGKPEILSIANVTFDEICDGDPVSLPEPESIDLHHHSAAQVNGGWEFRGDNGAWTAMPSTWSRELHNGASIRYHIESLVCEDFGDDSQALEVRVNGAPAINDTELPETISTCVGQGLGLDVSENISWNQPEPGSGQWEVSVDGSTDWGSHNFNPDHIAASFDGWFLRYHLEGTCGTGNSKSMQLNLLASANINISGMEQVAIMNGFWPGEYYYYSETPGLTWTLTPPIWSLETLEEGRGCKIVVTRIGRATLSASLGTGVCGYDEMEINASSFGVDEQEEIPLDIYPNPARQTATVVSREIEEVKVYNMMGQLLMRVDGHSADRVELTVEHLSTALYLVEVKTKMGNKTLLFSVL